MSPRPTGPPNRAPNAPPRLTRGRGLVLALLAAATFAAFAGVLENGWILYDDDIYVTDNPHVNQGLTLEAVRRFLHTPHGGNWHPLTSYSHLLDVQLFGLAPAGHHAVSLAFHVLNAVLLAWVLFRLTGGWWRSVLVAALFALHPLRVESVAWISERKDVLSTFFFLLTLEAYRRWVARPDPGRYATVAAAYALGLMSKPMLVTLPFLLMLLDVWPLGRLRGLARASGSPIPPRVPGRSPAELLREKWPLFALAVASSVVTFLVQRNSGAMIATANLSLAGRAGNALLSYGRYIGMTFWPAGLAPFYPLIRAVNVPAAALAAAGLVAVTGLAFWQARRRPYLAVGWFWYVGTLVPVIGLIQVGIQAYADRYTYIPVIGLLIALVWGVGDLVAGSRPGRVAASGVSVLLLAGFGAATVQQVALWKNTRTLFTHAVRVTDENAVAEQSLGIAFEADSQPAEALRHLRRAVEIAPDYFPGQQSLGVVLARQGRFAESVQHLQKAVELRPGDSDAAYSLGHSLRLAGRLDEAEAAFRGALRLEPDLLGALDQLGTVLFLQGHAGESAELFRRAVALAPSNSMMHYRLAMALMMLGGHPAEAADHLRQVIRARPDSPQPLVALAWLLATCPEPAVRDTGEALRLAGRAVELTGARDPRVLDTLAAAQAAAGRFDEAIRTARGAIQLALRHQAADVARGIRERLALYERGIAYSEPASSGTRPPS